MYGETTPSNAAITCCLLLLYEMCKCYPLWPHVQVEAQREWEQEMWEANERAEAEKALQQKQQKAEDQQKAQESLLKEVCTLATYIS